MTEKPSDPEALLQFWFDEVGPDRWYAPDPALDAEVAKRYADNWRRGRRGRLRRWEDTRDGSLALVVLLDQFPRNMFRGTAMAFSSDAAARAVAGRAIERGFDAVTPSKRRPFFYMPYMHSETLADQDRCIALIGERLGAESGNLAYALEHRDQIVRFGRFPGRNAALGRVSTPDESAFLKGRPRY